MNGAPPLSSAMNGRSLLCGGGLHWNRHPGLRFHSSISLAVHASSTFMCATAAGMEVTSTTSRKIRKPLMEKKRRARINDSLNELRRLMAEASTEESERAKAAKLEKADILELAVKHVQYLHDRLGLSGQKENVRGQDDRTSQKTCDEQTPSTKKTSVNREIVRVTRLPGGEVALIISTRPTSHPRAERPSHPRLVWRPW